MADVDEQDRLFVKDGFKHYRRLYSRGELRWGLACGAALISMVGWVGWRRSHPVDPNLFDDGAGLLEKANANAVVGNNPATAAPPAAGRGAALAEAAVDRGPIPPNLGGDGFREDKLSSFDAENLYVKIDGRADYFKAFGFRKLTALLLVAEADPAMTIDIEIYDHGTAANALGAYGGERSPNIKPESDGQGQWHIERNALYMARGPHYVRVLGSDESPAVATKLKALQKALSAGMKGEAQPWAYEIFAGLGIEAGNLAYLSESAFSLAFASDVWIARPLGKDNDLEIFVCALADVAAAKKRAVEFQKAFLAGGKKAGTAGPKTAGALLAKEEFLGTFSTATAVDRFVVGVRGAADAAAATTQIIQLMDTMAALPAATKDRAHPATTAKGSGDGYE